MKRGYAIRCLKSTHLGFIVETLGKDSQWYVACNNCLFKTLVEAKAFFKISNHELRGSSIWVEGPRGGRHRVNL